MKRKKITKSKIIMMDGNIPIHHSFPIYNDSLTKLPIIK
nr:MAG TPA: hypothetical protein [Caudoviricetes sp.]